jgi:hypothetical protein
VADAPAMSHVAIFSGLGELEKQQSTTTMNPTVANGKMLLSFSIFWDFSPAYVIGLSFWGDLLMAI